MIQTLLITWRETLEAALIVGILVTYLSRSDQRAGLHYVWLGAVAAVLAALGCAAVSRGAVTLLEPDTQELLQAGILFVAVGVLSWMVLWMNRRGQGIRGDLHRKAERALEGGRLFGLAVIAFVAVFREGVETVLFLWGVVAEGSGSAAALVGAGLAGAGLAIGTAWLFFRGFAFLRLQTFFRIREPANPRQGARKDQLRVEVEAVGREHSARFRRRCVVVADGEKRRPRSHAGSDVTLVEGAGPLISGGGVGLLAERRVRVAQLHLRGNRLRICASGVLEFDRGLRVPLRRQKALTAREEPLERLPGTAGGSDGDDDE